MKNPLNQTRLNHEQSYWEWYPKKEESNKKKGAVRRPVKPKGVHCVSSLLAWTIMREAVSEDLHSSSRTVSFNRPCTRKLQSRDRVDIMSHVAGSFLASQALLHSANLLEVLQLTNASVSFSIPMLPVFLWKLPRPSKTNKHWSSSRGDVPVWCNVKTKQWKHFPD